MGTFYDMVLFCTVCWAQYPQENMSRSDLFKKQLFLRNGCKQTIAIFSGKTSYIQLKNDMGMLGKLNEAGKN